MPRVNSSDNALEKPLDTGGVVVVETRSELHWEGRCYAEHDESLWYTIILGRQIWSMNKTFQILQTNADLEPTLASA